MSKPVLSDLFTFSGRRNRKSYVFYHVSLVAMALVGFIVATLLSVMAPVVGLMSWGVYIIAMAAMTVSGFAVTAQRIRDIGYSGCWVFLYLIPYVGFAASLALYFVPSNPGENKYGPSCI